MNYAQIGGNVKGVLDVVWCTQILVRIFLRKSFVVSIDSPEAFIPTHPPIPKVKNYCLSSAFLTFQIIDFI